MYLPLYYRFGAVFLWDSGSSVGTISGHIKTINSLSYKPTRPFRIVTASEDHSTCFFEGPPFKFKLRIDVCMHISTCLCLSKYIQLYMYMYEYMYV